MKRVALGVVGVVVAIASSSSAAPAPQAAPVGAPALARIWKITPPPDWTDISEAVQEAKDIQEQRAELAALNQHSSVEVYESGDGGLLHVLHGLPQRSSLEPTSELGGWERGVRRTIAEDARELSYERRFTGKALIADATWMYGDQTVYTRYTAGFDTSTRLVFVAATCAGPEARCLAATRSLT
jgi:hypothetical protein